MNKLEYLHHKEGNEYLVLKTSYYIGGQNYGTGETETRGIYLHLTNENSNHKRKKSPKIQAISLILTHNKIQMIIRNSSDPNRCRKVKLKIRYIIRSIQRIKVTRC